MLDSSYVLRDVPKLTYADEFAGVYFLLHRGVVVYIGQSNDVRKRVDTHSNDCFHRFTQAVFVRIRNDEMRLEVERILIDHFKPKNNGALGTRRRYFEDEECARIAACAAEMVRAMLFIEAEKKESESVVVESSP